MSKVIKGLVSTIIPVYNRAHMVDRAVDSVLAQTYRPVEIILVDDGSTDGVTPAQLDALERKHQDIIRVIHRENGGPGLARESGRLVALGEFIQYLDSDDWLSPDKFEVQVEALNRNPDCEIAYGQSRFTYANGELIAEPSKKTGQKFDYLFPTLLVDRWWHTHTPLFRRNISDAAGPWPRRRPEDWDLEARMGALKPKLIYCDGVFSCQVAHFSDERVSFGDKTKYALDETWFLPRLYECAVKAGVKPGSDEMQRFSRWAFYLARQIGVMGEPELATQMLKLSRTAAAHFSISRVMVTVSSRLLGWKRTVQIFDWLRDIPKIKEATEKSRG